MASETDLAVDGLDEVFGTDENVEADGAWVDVPGVQGMQMCVRSQASLKVENFVRRQTQKHLAIHRAGQVLSAESEAKDQLEQLVRVVVTGWRGFLKPDKTPIPFNEANLRGVLTKYPHLRKWAMSQSQQIENYRRKETESMEGNSVKPSEPS